MALPLIADFRGGAPEFASLVVDDVTREAVRQAAASLGWATANVRKGGVAAARDYIENNPSPPVLLVDISDSDDPLAAMDGLAEVCDAHTSVVAIGNVNDVALYRGLMQLGVSDYLVKPVPGETLAAALRQARQTDRPAPQPRSSRSIALIGARGGVGVTTLAVSLAWAFAHERQLQTVLLDLDLQFGAAALSLDIEAGRGLRELLAHPDRIDSLLIGSAASAESERLRILAAEEPLDAAADVAPDGVQSLMTALAGGSDAVVLDMPRRLDAPNLSAIAGADMVGIVTDLSLAGMRDAHRLAALLASARGEAPVLVIGNRVGGVAGEVPRAEFERALGRPLDFAIPFDAKAAAAAAEQGKALLGVAKAGPCAAELRRLADRVCGAAATPPQPTSWLSRALGK